MSKSKKTTKILTIKGKTLDKFCPHATDVANLWVQFAGNRRLHLQKVAGDATFWPTMRIGQKVTFRKVCGQWMFDDEVFRGVLR